MDTSFMSRAKNAFQNAAAKAERLLTEIKEDFKTDFGMSTGTDKDGSVRGNSVPLKACPNQRLQETLLSSETENRRSTDPSYHEKKGTDNASIKVITQKDILEYDNEMENLKLHYVPEKMKEHEFWGYYFMAVDLMKQEGFELSANSYKSHQKSIPCHPQPESPKKDPIEEAAYQKATSVRALPSSKLLRRLAAVIEIANSADKVKELVAVGKIDRDVLQSGGLVSGLAAMKNSILRDSKDLKSCRTDEVQGYLASLFEADTMQNGDSVNLEIWCQATLSKLPEEMHATPPGSFVSRLAEIMGGLTTGRMMIEFWYGVVAELRRRWEDGRPIPRLPVDAIPDLRYCLLHQKLQVINCCIARQKRHATDLAVLDALSEGAERMGLVNAGDADGSSQQVVHIDGTLEPSRVFVKGKEGQLLMRLGADCPAANLRMLETGEQVYSPATQEGPVLTEDLIKETEELILRTGSVGAGCSQLLSDMQAFKAANPGCILEDFVRWYSPLDWRQDCVTGSSDKDPKKDSGSRGYLSTRMQSEGNLWQELWISAKAVPAARQAPLFDEDLAVEHTLNELEDIPPADLFRQMFKAVLSTGFAIAESSPLFRSSVGLQFSECREFLVSTCKKGIEVDELEQLCQVYETIETMLQCLPENLQDLKVPHSRESDGARPIAMLTERGSRYYSNLITNERGLLKRFSREQPTSQSKPENGFNILTRFLEVKSSLFEKKSAQAASSVGEEKAGEYKENEWTLI